MKKLLAAGSALLLCIILCAPALAAPDGNTGVLPVTPVFTFSNGIGAWFSVCTVHTDGTFEGYSQDIDMGVTGDGYPNGTVYTSTFRGAFHQITQVDAYTWSMKVASLTTEEVPGNEWIEDGVRYIAIAAVGIPEVGGEVLLYLPGHDRASLPESFLWWTGSGDTDSPQIDYYGLYNVEEGFGFDSAGSQTAPEETAPEETAPEETAPEETAPEETAPEETAPEETAPEETAPEETAPEETAPEETAPEETAPEETAPEETAPEETAPEETAPEETAPEETAPEETAPEETAPEETAPEETAPEETAPEADGESEVYSGADMPFAWNVIVAAAFMVLASAVVVLAVYLVRKLKAARQAGPTPPPADPPAQPPREP